MIPLVLAAIAEAVRGVPGIRYVEHLARLDAEVDSLVRLPSPACLVYYEGGQLLGDPLGPERVYKSAFGALLLNTERRGEGDAVAATLPLIEEIRVALDGKRLGLPDAVTPLAVVGITGQGYNEGVISYVLHIEAWLDYGPVMEG